MTYSIVVIYYCCAHNYIIYGSQGQVHWLILGSTNLPCDFLFHRNLQTLLPYLGYHHCSALGSEMCRSVNSLNSPQFSSVGCIETYLLVGVKTVDVDETTGRLDYHAASFGSIDVCF